MIKMLLRNQKKRKLIQILRMIKKFVYARKENLQRRRDKSLLKKEKHIEKKYRKLRWKLK